jgi:hypothetical protein
MTPPDNYIRLALENPSDSKNTRFAYDIRPSGESSYTWNVELTTTFRTMNAKLVLTNMENIPDEYHFTLTDKGTGITIDLSGDTSIDVSLSSATTKEFELKATKEYTKADDIDRPGAFGITGVMPNPFNPIVTVSYSLQTAQEVKVNVYNTSGQLIETLVNGRMAAGHHSVVWNAASCSSGLYIVSLESTGKRDSRKITLMK